MGLREIHADATSGRTSCKVRTIIDSLEGDDLDWLNEVMDSDINTAAIARTLARGGVPLAHSTLQRHRRRACSCSQEG